MKDKTAFRKHLERSGLRGVTITGHLNNVSLFMQWLQQSDHEQIEQVSYPILLEYVRYLKDRHLATSTINIRLGNLRRYFDYLKETGTIMANPARHLFIKGAERKITEQPLSRAGLESLYRAYVQPCDHRTVTEATAHERNKIIVGLMICQGLHSGELGRLERDHVNIHDGYVHIPGTSRSNERDLKLESKQILPLHQYLTEHAFSDNRLIGCGTHNVTRHITCQLRGIDPAVRSARHIRSSVILHWLRIHPKRKVQYMLGHKCISSLEHYEQQELEGLTGQLAKHHPLAHHQ